MSELKPVAWECSFPHGGSCITEKEDFKDAYIKGGCVVKNLYSQDQVAQLQADVKMLRDALERIAQPVDAGCGCSFPCRCDTPEAEAINAEEMRENASQALAATAPGESPKHGADSEAGEPKKQEK